MFKTFKKVTWEHMLPDAYIILNFVVVVLAYKFLRISEIARAE